MTKSERDFRRALQKAERFRRSLPDPETVEEIVPPRGQTDSGDEEWTTEDWERIWWRTSG